MSATFGDLLVVEDDDASRDLITRRLQRHGYSVMAAPDGGQALQLIHRHPFSLVLLDVEMPGLTGLEVLAAVRKERTPIELPIIMVTARHDARDITDALRRGANDYVTKPVNFPAAIARIQAQLSLKSAGIWHWNLVSGQLFLSPQWKVMLGCSDEQWSTSPDEWFARVHPEDVAPLRAAIAALLEGRSPYLDVEHRLLHRDGSCRRMRCRGLVVRNDRGQASGVSGSLTEIGADAAGDPGADSSIARLIIDRFRGALGRPAGATAGNHV